MSKNYNASALVSGGNFFLGWQLTEFLLNNNCQVIFLNGKKGLPLDVLREFKKTSSFFLEEEDILSEKVFEKITLNFPQLNYVFSLDSFFQEEGSEKGKEDYLLKIENLLKISVETKAKFLFAKPLFIFDEDNDSEKIKDITKTSIDPENLIALYSEREKVNFRIVKVGEIYGPGMPLENKGLVSKIIGFSFEKKLIQLEEDSSEKIMPLFVDDGVSGLCRAMFATGTAGEIFTLVGQEISSLEFAQRAKSFLPTPNPIELVSKKEKLNLPLLKFKNPPGWQPTTPLNEGLKKTFEWLLAKPTFQIEKEIPILIREKTPEEIKKELFGDSLTTGSTGRSKKKKSHFSWTQVLSGVIGLILSLSTPFIFIALNLFLAFHHFDQAFEAGKKADFYKVSSNSQKASFELDLAIKSYRLIRPLLEVVGSEQILSRTEKSLILARMVARTSREGGKYAQEASRLFYEVLLAEGTDFEKSVDETKLSLQTFLDSAAATQGFLDQFSGNEPFLGSKVALLQEKLPLARQMGDEALQLTQTLPQLLGNKKKVTYLILFQNNMELRPTGGFIGSFALVTFEKGRLLDFEVHDVYSADGQLRGYVEPPEKLKEFLGLSGGWFFRDSNWDPDFPTSAGRAEWFLEKEIGRSVDGVIAVDLFLLEKILREIGGVELLDYNEKITADNFFEKVEYQIEADFFPGSTEKKDFLGNVVNRLFEEVKRLDQKKMGFLATAFYKSFEEKDILVFLHESKAAEAFSRLGWDGAIKQVDCQKVLSQNCLADYLMLVEANVGINKANYFVKRKLDQEIELKENGEITHRMVIVYENQSPNNVFPAGNYKNYLRIFTPFGSGREEIVVKGGKKEEKPKVEKRREHNHTVFGFLVEVPVGEKRTIQITYSLPQAKNFKEGDLVFVWQKQPGTFSDPFNLTLSLPRNLELEKISPSNFLTNGKTLRYNNTLSKDIVFQFNIRPTNAIHH